MTRHRLGKRVGLLGRPPPETRVEALVELLKSHDRYSSVRASAVEPYDPTRALCLRERIVSPSRQLGGGKQCRRGSKAFCADPRVKVASLTFQWREFVPTWTLTFVSEHLCWSLCDNSRCWIVGLLCCRAKLWSFSRSVRNMELSDSYSTAYLPANFAGYFLTWPHLPHCVESTGLLLCWERHLPDFLSLGMERPLV